MEKKRTVKATGGKICFLKKHTAQQAIPKRSLVKLLLCKTPAEIDLLKRNLGFNVGGLVSNFKLLNLLKQIF